MDVSCQFSLYPLGVEHLRPTINAVLAARQERGLTVEARPMSSLVSVWVDAVFAGLEEGFTAAAECSWRKEKTVTAKTRSNSPAANLGAVRSPATLPAPGEGELRNQAQLDVVRRRPERRLVPGVVGPGWSRPAPRVAGALTPCDWRFALRGLGAGNRSRRPQPDALGARDDERDFGGWHEEKPPAQAPRSNRQDDLAATLLVRSATHLVDEAEATLRAVHTVAHAVSDPVLAVEPD